MGRKLKVLLVDDFQLIRMILKRNLNDLGIDQISEAADGKEALNTILETKKSGDNFDLVFCDWNLPHMTGIEILQAVKKDPYFTSLPFVMVTSEAEKSHVDQARAAGAMDYIVKPFDMEKIKGVLDALLKRVAKAG